METACIIHISTNSGNMMEQECVDGLYRALGISAGGEFSSDDVRVLFRKVFHSSCTADDVHMAIKKIAGDEEEWSCVGEKILDVLLEIERERERRDELYWDQRLLNAGKLDNLHVMEQQSITAHQVPDSMRSCSDTNTFKQAPNASHTDTFTYGTAGVNHLQEQERSCRPAMLLKRTARRRWARLVAEGVHGLLPPRWNVNELTTGGQTLGYVTVPDLLLLVEMKYDMVALTLYAEMLQEHYGEALWESMPPWQQDQEKEGLGDLAEDALGSGDLLRLAELPGAFRIYKMCDAVFHVPESAEEAWSAVSVLAEVHAACQQERVALSDVSKRLDRENLRLLCLHISLATLRAQREKMSHAALLAARQSWETWPCISSPSKKELAAQWLQLDEQEVNDKEFLISASPQQAVLQWLVLSQEQERKFLLRLLHSVSLEDLQGHGHEQPSRDEDEHKQDALKDVCVRRLRQIQAALQTHARHEIQPVQNCAQFQPEPLPQTLHTYASSHPQILVELQARMCDLPTGLARPQWGPCAVLLLTQLIELQEAQVSAVLTALVDTSAQRLQALRDEYQSQFHEQRFANSLHLLNHESPCTSKPLPFNDPAIAPKSHAETITPPNSGTGELGGNNSSPADPIQGAYEDPDPVIAEDAAFEREDLCTGCGNGLEELPYLEILCVSDTADISKDGDIEMEMEGAQEEQKEGSPRKTPQSFEKQDSLITLAWSKPPEDGTHCQEEAAASSSAECSMKLVEEASEGHNKDGHKHDERVPGVSHVEVLDTSLFQSDATLQQLQRTVEQMQLEPVMERHIAERPEETEEPPSESNSQTQAFVAETEEIVHRPSSACSPKTGARGTMEEVRVEMETCPPLTESELEGHEPPHPEDHKHISQVDFSTKESVMMDHEKPMEPVSVLERERTMRNLVDIQRKVEMKQQRDKERQLLRVQERLSIIQNRKAEEDLLGLKQGDRLRHLTHDLPQEDKSQQKTVVRERLEQLRRERSCVMQSKRDRNTASFKELLAPVALHSADMEDGAE